MNKAILIFFFLLNILCIQAQSPVANKFATTANEIGLDFWTPIRYDKGFIAFYKRTLPDASGKNGKWRLALRLAGGYRNNTTSGYELIPRGNGANYTNLDTTRMRMTILFGGISGQFQWKRLIWYSGCDIMYRKRYDYRKRVESQSVFGGILDIRVNTSEEFTESSGLAFFTGMDLKITRNISLGTEINTQILLSHYKYVYNGILSPASYELYPVLSVPRIIYLGIHF